MKTKRISKYLNINELVSLRCLSHLVAELTHVPIIILSSPTWVLWERPHSILSSAETRAEGPTGHCASHSKLISTLLLFSEPK